MKTFEQTWKLAENVLDQDALIFAESIIGILCREYGNPEPEEHPLITDDEPFDSPVQDTETTALMRRLLSTVAQPDPPSAVLYDLLPIIVLLEHLVRNDTAIYERLLLPRTDETQDLMKKIKLDTRELKLDSWKRLRLHILQELLPRAPRPKRLPSRQQNGDFHLGGGVRPRSPDDQERVGTEKPKIGVGGGSPRASPPSSAWYGTKPMSRGRSPSPPQSGVKSPGEDKSRMVSYGGGARLADMQNQRFEMLTSYFLQAVECLSPSFEDLPALLLSFGGECPPGSRARPLSPSPAACQEQKRGGRRDSRCTRRWEDIFDFVKEEIRNRMLQTLHGGSQQAVPNPVEVARGRPRTQEKQSGEIRPAHSGTSNVATQPAGTPQPEHPQSVAGTRDIGPSAALASLSSHEC
ncbi:hypothetical protein BESB_009860 [Besnoitia besnoiti]|uniref:Uncharacterized protein n=1 Tax=Besnoitia besnoiti TaxID=94643 RepID=A0A2A9MMP3_BESBE|nr:hypothetical protein BESB_009860 [Besnoitia besnoiti]PFH38644.1 hypothetical protein BESB_009860 [Besnoitia besnoiti]